MIFPSFLCRQAIQIIPSPRNLDVAQRVAVPRIAHHLHRLYRGFFLRKPLQSAVLQSLRLAVHRLLLLLPTLHWNMFAHGCKELRKAIGCRWQFHQMAATACQKV
jgi:hypothetical protein